jgi:hypothetical protein
VEYGCQFVRKVVTGKGQGEVKIQVVPTEERQGDLTEHATGLEFELERPERVLNP